MTTFSGLQPFLDRGALHAMLLQDQLIEATEALGPNRWDLDMTDGVLVFTSEADPSKTLAMPAQLIATMSASANSVLWGWAHPQGSETGAAAALRDAGAAESIAELTQGEVMFPDDFNAYNPDELAEAAHEIGTCVVGGIGIGPYYSAPIGENARAVFLLRSTLPDITLADALMKLPRMLSTGRLRDPRTALWGLAGASGWSFGWNPDFTESTVSDEHTTARFTFTVDGQLTGASTS